MHPGDVPAEGRGVMPTREECNGGPVTRGQCSSTYQGHHCCGDATHPDRRLHGCDHASWEITADGTTREWCVMPTRCNEPCSYGGCGTPCKMPAGHTGGCYCGEKPQERPDAAEVAALRAEIAKLRVRLEQQTEYSIALQRLIEGLRRGETQDPGLREKAPHLAGIAAEVEAEVAKLRAVGKRLASALHQYVSHGGPRAHRLGCQCSGHDGDGVTCRDMDAAARAALIEFECLRNRKVEYPPLADDAPPTCGCECHPETDANAPLGDKEPTAFLNVTGLGSDEIRVLEYIRDRLRLGQAQYGRIDLATDARDMRREAAEENADEVVYDVIRRLQVRLRDLGQPAARRTAAAEGI